MDALNRLVGVLASAKDVAVAAAVAAASLAILGSLAGPAWDVAKSLVAAGSAVMASGGPALLGALATIGLAKYLNS